MAASRTSKVFALSLGHALTTLVALVSGMVLARVLSKADLATYRQTMLAYDVVLPLLSLGLASGIYYFLPTEKIRRRGVVLEGLLLMAGMGLLYALFIAAGGNHLLAKRFSNPAIVATLAYLVPLPLLLLPAKLLSPVLVVQNQVNRLTAFNILTSLALATGVIAACLAWRTPDAMILVRVGVGVGVGLASIWMMWTSVPRDDWRPQWGHMKAMVAYSLPLAGAAALGTLHIQLDKLIVSSLCAPEEFAVYSNGAIEIPLIGILTGSIAAVIQPDLRRMVAERNLAGALDLFRQSAIKSAALLFPVMMFLLVSAEPFILTLFSSRYSGSVAPFRLYLLILPVRVVQFGALMMVLGLNRVMLYRAFAGLLANLVLSIVLVQKLGYLGAVISTVICIYAVNCTLNLGAICDAIGCRWWQVLPFGGLSRLALVAALAALPAWALRAAPLPALAPVGRLLIDGACYAGALVALVRLFHVETYLREGRILKDRFLAKFRTS